MPEVNSPANSAVSSVDTITNSDYSSQGNNSNSVGLADDFETFLSLLTTQLQNQNPTDPMDANQFTQQLVDFAGVEQTINTNTKLDELIALSQTSTTNETIFSSLSLVGQTIEASGNVMELVKGSATFAYTLPAESASSFIEIEDQNGKVVYSTGGADSAGYHEFKWDGKDNAGKQLTDGQYLVKVSALDATNNSVEVSTSVRGVVTSVISGSGNAYLTIGNTAVPIDNILGVYAAEETSADTIIDTDSESDSGELSTTDEVDKLQDSDSTSDDDSSEESSDSNSDSNKNNDN